MVWYGMVWYGNSTGENGREGEIGYCNCNCMTNISCMLVCMYRHGMIWSERKRATAEHLVAAHRDEELY